MPTQFKTQEDVERAFVKLQESVTDLAAEGKEREAASAENVKTLKELQRSMNELRTQANARQWDNLPLTEKEVIAEYVVRQGDEGERIVRDNSSHFATAKESRSAVCLRTFTTRDGVTHLGLLDDPNPKSAWQREVQRTVSDRAVLRILRPGSKALDGKLRGLLEVGPEPIRRAFVDVAGSGGEWVPDVELAELGRTMHVMEGRVANLFPQANIPAGGTIKEPWLSRGLRPYKAGAITGDDPNRYASSTITTTEATRTAVKMAVRMQYDPDAVEDSIVPALPEFQREVVSAIAHGIDDTIINGDNDGTHQDTIAAWNTRGLWGTSGLGGSSDHRTLWDGLRNLAIAKSTSHDGSAAQTYAGMLAAVAKLDSVYFFGDTVVLVSPEYMLAKIMPSWTEFQGIDKVANLSTLTAGALGVAGGFPIVMTSFLTADLNATGLFDNSTTDYTGMLVVNRARYRFGVRKALMVEQARDITRGINDIVATQRCLFYEYPPAALAEKNVSYAYKLAKS